MKFETSIVKGTVVLFENVFEASTDSEAWAVHSKNISDYSIIDDTWDSAFLNEIDQDGNCIRTPSIKQYQIEIKHYWYESKRCDVEILDKVYTNIDEAHAEIENRVLKELRELNNADITIENIETEEFAFRADLHGMYDAVIRLWYDDENYDIVTIYNIIEKEI